MPRRRIGQEAFEFGAKEGTSALDRLHDLINWSLPEAALRDVYAAGRGEAAWPPLSLFKALLIAVWHDLYHGKLAEAPEDRGSFRRFCGFSRHEPTPERTAFVRFRRKLVARALDRALFEAVTDQLRAKVVAVKTGALIDATAIGFANQGDAEAGWSGHRSRKAVHGYKAHVVADAETTLVEVVGVPPATCTTLAPASSSSPTIRARSTPTAPTSATASRALCVRAAASLPRRTWLRTDKQDSLSV